MKDLLKRLLVLIFFGLFFFAYRSCTKGYDRYAVYVEVSEEGIFDQRLNPSDPRLISHGRKPHEEIIHMDKDQDHGDGPHSGRFRWYACGGIDCEEGWENQF